MPGTYVLRHVNYDALPVTLFADSLTRIDLTAATITLNDDSTFVDARTFMVAPNGAAPGLQADTIRGVYFRLGDKVTLTPTSGQPYVVVWEGVLLTQYAEGFTFRYRR